MSNTLVHCFKLENFKTVIFDFDGVILDSNSIKKSAIQASVKSILAEDAAREFVDYFVNLNGVPREQKIAKYIPADKRSRVLKKYEEILEAKLKDAELISGVAELIKSLHALKIKLFVLSGGTESEVKMLLRNLGLYDYFEGVFGGPKNKEKNLQYMEVKKPVLYFGDSEIDYLVSTEHQFSFVFVYGASSIKNWKDKTKNWNIFRTIKNFEEL